MAKKALEQEAAAKPRLEAPPASLAQRVWVALAAWFVPGLGHLLLGRKWRALILFLSIVPMFLVGLAMQGEFFALESSSYLRTLGYLGVWCVGLPRGLASFFGYSGGNPFFVSSDYGTAFLVSAGMLNVLTVFDAYDIRMGRKP